MLSIDLDQAIARVSAGERLSADELRRLAEMPDILPIGMLADAVRRRINGTRVTFLRVALVDATQVIDGAAVPSGSRHARLTGSPETLSAAVDSVMALRAVADSRTVSGFSWVDVERWATSTSGAAAVLKALREAGLDALAEIPLDLEGAPERALTALADGGLGAARLTVTKAAPIGDRLPQFLHASDLVARFSTVDTIAPLPMALNPLRPTTGYDDVKAVALARLVLPDVPHVQVDWLRYGPKLAQVALTFGADDIDNVSPIEAAGEGRRRETVEELRRNVQSAGFTAVERDGHFATLD